MQVTRGYKTELDLNNEQTTACLKHAGAARFAYNWGLSRYEAEYKAGRKTPNAAYLHKELNALKQTDLPWLYEVSKCAPQEALRSLEKTTMSPDGKGVHRCYPLKKRIPIKTTKQFLKRYRPFGSGPTHLFTIV